MLVVAHPCLVSGCVAAHHFFVTVAISGLEWTRHAWQTSVGISSPWSVPSALTIRTRTTSLALAGALQNGHFPIDWAAAG
jgi:hypothetical protein